VLAHDVREVIDGGTLVEAAPATSDEKLHRLSLVDANDDLLDRVEMVPVPDDRSPLTGPRLFTRSTGLDHRQHAHRRTDCLDMIFSEHLR